jgi:hypothetical protein
MTAPAVAGRPPVAWTRVTWVAWRQHRAALAGVAALLAGLGLYLLIMGLKIHQAYAAMVAGSHPAGTQYCQALRHALAGCYGTTAGSVTTSGLNAQTVPFLLLAVPGLIGVFAGAPVIARELETGTFRFAWTQGCGRRRWALSRLALLAAALGAWTVLDVTTVMALRQHYLAPLTGHGRNIPVSAWLLRVWPPQHGVPSYSYQPVSRFWSFQLIEGGWLLALALVLLAGADWLVRRGE